MGEACGVVVRQCVDNVVRMEQRLLDEVPDVCIVYGVEEAIAVTTDFDDVSHAEPGKVLGHRWRLHAKVFC